MFPGRWLRRSPPCLILVRTRTRKTERLQMGRQTKRSTTPWSWGTGKKRFKIDLNVTETKNRTVTETLSPVADLGQDKKDNEDEPDAKKQKFDTLSLRNRDVTETLSPLENWTKLSLSFISSPSTTKTTQNHKITKQYCCHVASSKESIFWTPRLVIVVVDTRPLSVPFLFRPSLSRTNRLDTKIGNCTTAPQL